MGILTSGTLKYAVLLMTQENSMTREKRLTSIVDNSTQMDCSTPLVTILTSTFGKIRYFKPPTPFLEVKSLTYVLLKARSIHQEVLMEQFASATLSKNK